MVVTSLPSTSPTTNPHERTASPLMCTVQAPHCAMPHPNLVPVNPISSRMTQSSGVSGSVSSRYAFPFTFKDIMARPVGASLRGQRGWRRTPAAGPNCARLTPRAVAGIQSRLSLPALCAVLRYRMGFAAIESHASPYANALDCSDLEGHSPRPARNRRMTETAELLGARPAPQVRVVGAVSAAHFVSHYYIILLAPLLPFVRADYGVSYTEIGLAFAIFNTVSAVLQAPAGFLVDRLGARLPLISALVLGASAFLVVGLTSSYWLLIAMFAVAGTANAVYHPADYALLSQHVPAKRIGPAFSFHTFAGIAGSAAAPPTLLIMQQLWGWRGAFIGASVLGFAVAAALIGVGDLGPAQA